MRFNPFHLLRRRGERESDPLAWVPALSVWSKTPVGMYVISDEQQVVDQLLAPTGGYRAMLLATMDDSFSIDAAPQLHRFCLAPFDGSKVAAVTEMDALPLPSDVVDVAILHHVLDFSEYPHEALKEAARVVQPSGHLLVVGFNPWSLFGICRLLRSFGRRNGGVWQSRCLSVSRVVDWLKFVGFQAEKIIYGGYRPPVQAPRLLARLGFMDRLGGRLRLPTGSYYVIVSRKVRLRPIRGKPEWLPAAIKPVTLASRSRVQKRDKSD